MLGLLPLFLLAAALITLIGTVAMVRAATRPDSNGYAWCLAHGLPTCPADLGTTGSEIPLQLSQGDSTTAFDLAGRDPDGPCVVFVHGHTATRFSVLRHVAPLIDHARRVLTFDLPGHGDCSAKRCTMGVREPHDIARVLEQIDDGQTPIVLFGSSMGAQCAIATAAGSARDRVAGLILLGAYRHYAEAIPGHLRRHALPRYPFLPLGQAWLQLIHGPASHFDRADDARKLRCPVLFLHGELDDLCPLTTAQALHRAAQQAGNDAQLVVFPDGGHTSLPCTHPDLYRQTLAPFLQRFRTPTNQPRPTPHLYRRPP